MSRVRGILISLLLVPLTPLIISEDAAARELDGERKVTTEQIQLSQALPMTLVVRRREGTHRVEVLHLSEALPADDNSYRLVSTASYFAIDASGKMIGELDHESSTSSWIFRIVPPPGGYGPAPVNRRGGPVSGPIPGDNSPDAEPSDDGPTLPDRDLPSGRDVSAPASRRPVARPAVPPRPARVTLPQPARPHRPRFYRPRYTYRGYSYPYSPYYRYYRDGYDYEYYGWPHANPFCRR